MKKYIFFIAIILFPVICGAAPHIYYSDLITGPKTGGQDNKGAFVTIWGNGFGSSQGTSTVTIGSGEADNYPVWSDTKITFQLGSNAATGNIVITVGGETASSADANPAFSFTVGSGAIYFVDSRSGGTDSGTYDNPWTSPASFVSQITAGDICYFRGTSNPSSPLNYSGLYGNGSGTSANFSLDSDHAGTASAYVGYIAYPGEYVSFTNNGYNFFFSHYETYSKASYSVVSQLILYGDCSIASGGEWCDENAGANYLRAIGNTIHGNYGNDNTQTGMMHTNGQYTYFIGNEIDNDATVVQNNNHAIYVECGADNVWVGYNYIHDMVIGWAIQVHSDRGAGGCGSGYCSNTAIWTNIHIFNNYIVSDGTPTHGSCRGITASDLHPSSYGYIYNNILDGSGGFQGFGAIWVYSGTWKVYNNTIYNALDTGYDEYALGTNNEYGNGSTATWKNNIIWTDGMDYFGTMNGSSLGTIDGNLYYGNGTGPNMGSDAHAVNGNPSFTSPGSEFSLQSTSIARDAGVDVSDLTALDYDYINTSRPQNSVNDIGAYEYEASSSTIPMAGGIGNAGGVAFQ